MKYFNTLISISAIIVLFGCGPSPESNPEANKTASKAISKPPSSTTTVAATRPYDFQETTIARTSKTLLAQDYEQSPGTGSTLYDPNQFDYLWYVKNVGESAFFYKNTGITFTYAYNTIGIHDVLLEVYTKGTQIQRRSHLIKMTVQGWTQLSP